MKSPTEEEKQAWNLLFGGMTHLEICVRINELFLDKQTRCCFGQVVREYRFMFCFSGGLGHMPQEYEIERNKEMGIGRPNRPW